MEKSSSEISKKMFPAPSTLMRAESVLIFGSRTLRKPLLGTFAARTMGKERPPLVESRIFTFVVLTGALVVPATFQVTVCVPHHVTSVLGEITRKGPAEPAIVTCMLALLTPPPPARL